MTSQSERGECAVRVPGWGGPVQCAHDRLRPE